jgi:hypothetical protein
MIVPVCQQELFHFPIEKVARVLSGEHAFETFKNTLAFVVHADGRRIQSKIC